MLYFLTGNKNKLKEAQGILGNVKGYEIDLPEIQETDAHIIIENKLAEAKKHKNGEFIIEDTSLYFNAMNGLPGPLIKWFIETIGNEGLWKIISSYDDKTALAKTIIGYSDNEGKLSFFEGVVEGEIVAPRGETNFGWDPIFKPNGYDKTFAEMNQSEKNEISMRRLALENFKKSVAN